MTQQPTREELLKAFKYQHKVELNGKKFATWLKVHTNGEYVMVGKYQGSHKPVLIKHKKCGYVIKNKTSTQFKRNPLCPVCDTQPKRTDDSFRYEIKLKYGDEYEPLSPYVNTDTKMYFFHKDCGKIIHMRPVSLMNANGCYNCYGIHKLSYIELFRHIHKVCKDAYLDPQKEQNRYSISIHYLSCGHMYNTDYQYACKIKECPICKKHRLQRLKSIDYVHRVEDFGLVNIMDHYISQTVTRKLRVKCTNCGYVWKSPSSALINGHGCPKCHSSLGEYYICKLLDNYNVKYEYPKKFNDLRAKRQLHYDFFIPDQNILIEYQGGQHYEAFSYFGGTKRFKTQQKHDQMKRKYAKDHGYNLIEVPYTEDTLGKVKNYLVSHGLELSRLYKEIP